MSEYLLDHERSLRLGSFLFILALMMVLEWLHPRRRQTMPKFLRWSNNLALVAVDGLVLRLFFPVTAAVFAAVLQRSGWGLFNLLSLSPWISVPLSLILLDLAIYAQHILFHKLPWLWRLHRMHHADTEIDATTGIRFHPLEILLSMLFKFAVIAVLGAPPIAVLAFEVLLNACALFNHSNLALAPLADTLLRAIIVTPDMHRVHHSVVPEETDSNYGFNFSCWDRLFGTYREAPRYGQLGMTIGLNIFRSSRNLWIDRLLSIPFRKGSERDGG